MTETLLDTLVLTALPNVPAIRPGMNLVAIIAAGMGRAALRAAKGDVVILAQKIVSKAENRYVRLSDVSPSAEAIRLADICKKDPRLVELILSESQEVVRCRPGVIIVRHRHNYVMANAGIDASNVEGEEGDETVLLLPQDSDASAARIRQELEATWGVAIGVVINDSFGRAWRLGTVGTAIGIAGLPALMDLRGQPDRAGRKLMTTELGAADELAAAASLLMGQASEGRPIIHARGFPYGLGNGSSADLIRPPSLDMFR